MTERREKIADYALVAIGVAALFAVPHRIGGDGEARFATLERFVTTGHLESARYSVVAPLLATPLYLAGRAFGDARAGAALLNPILFACALAVLSRELAAEPPWLRRGVLVLLVFASMFANHVQVFYGEPLTALAVTLGVVWLSRERRAGALGWSAIILGAVNTPGAILGVCAIAIRDARRAKSYLPLAAPLVALVLSRLESLVVRGSLFATGYDGDAGFKTALPYSGLPGFSYPLVLGALAIVFSFGKGLLFFAPGLFVRPAKDASPRLAWIHGTLVWFVVGLALVYARWWAWYGGSFWGPRFFLVASVPACLALATRLRPADPPDDDRPLAAHVAIAAALAFSFWVGLDGFVFDQNGLDLCWKNDYALEAFCHFVPEMSPLFHPFVDFASAVPARARPLALGVCAFWAIACAWTGRRVFAGVTRRALSVMMRPR